jgi:hypothetical protein
MTYGGPIELKSIPGRPSFAIFAFVAVKSLIAKDAKTSAKDAKKTGACLALSKSHAAG